MLYNKEKGEPSTCGSVRLILQTIIRGLPSVRVFCILCCVRLFSLLYLNSAKSDIAMEITKRIK